MERILTRVFVGAILLALFVVLIGNTGLLGKEKEERRLAPVPQDPMAIQGDLPSQGDRPRPHWLKEDLPGILRYPSPNPPKDLLPGFDFKDYGFCKIPGHNTFYLKDFKILFTSIPKNSCTTIRQFLLALVGKYLPPEHKTKSHSRISQLVGDICLQGEKKAKKVMLDPTVLKIIVVRDPKERFLSAYLDKSVKHPTYRGSKWANLTFSQFVEFQERAFKVETLSYMDQHIRPQFVYAQQDQTWPWYMAIKFDGYPETLKKVLNSWRENMLKEELFSRIFFSNSTQGETQWSVYYTPELEKRVEALYHLDYQVFPLSNSP